MKYMTFNNSCFFTALANLLEDYNIDIQDRDIIGGSLIPYIFRYRKSDKSYYAGYQVQEAKFINHYLNKWELSFYEKKYSTGDLYKDKYSLISDITKFPKRCVISLKVLENSNRWHATIFDGVVDGVYRFYNMKYEESKESSYFYYTEEELIEKLADVVQFGWIAVMEEKVSIDEKHELDISIMCLEKYEKDIIRVCSELLTIDQREDIKERYFRALFISYYTVLKIIDDKALLKMVDLIRREYLGTFRILEEIILSDYIDIDKLKDIIREIKKDIN